MSADSRWWAVPLMISISHTAQHTFTRLIPPLIPILAIVLGLPLWMLGFLVTLYTLGMGLGQAPFGILADKRDRRLILAGGHATMAAGYVVFGLAPAIGAVLPTVTVLGVTITGTYQVMCGSIFFAGLGSSVTHPAGYPLITANVSTADKGKGLGMWGASSKIGDAAAPALVGVLILVLQWNEIVLALGLMGLVYAAALFVVLGREEFITLPAGRGESESTDAEGDETTVDEQPSVWDLDRRAFVYPMFVILIFFLTRMVATKGVDTFIPTYITELYAFNYAIAGYEFGPASVANFYFSALFLVAAVTQLFTGWVSDLYDQRKILIAFLCVTSATLASLALFRFTPIVLFLILLLLGGGLWGLNPARDALMSDISPDTYEGRTFGYMWTLAEVLGAMTPAIIGYIAETAGIQQSFGLLAVATMLAALSIACLFSDRVYAAPDRSSRPTR